MPVEIKEFDGHQPELIDIKKKPVKKKPKAEDKP